DPESFCALATAVVCRHRVQIVHGTAERNETTRREFDPYDLVLIEDGWYAVGYGFREKQRTFGWSPGRPPPARAAPIPTTGPPSRSAATGADRTGSRDHVGTTPSRLIDPIYTGPLRLTGRVRLVLVGL